MGAVAAGELGLRAGGYRYTPVRITARAGGDARELHAFHDRHVAYDPVLIWRPRPGLFSAFNAQGIRGAPLAVPKPAGTVRILVLGDSNTFGWMYDEGANWPAQLESLLRGTCAACEVANAGVWGYTSFQGLGRLRELLALDPDLVIVSFGANDAQPVMIPDAEYVRAHERAAWLARATARWRLAQLAVAAWDRAALAASRSVAPVPRVDLKAYEANLRAMIRETRARGAVPLLLTRPFIGVPDGPDVWKARAPVYNAATLAVGRAEGVPVVDVHAAFAERADDFADESHFNEHGHRRAAAIIAAAVRPIVADRQGTPRSAGSRR